MSAAAATRRKPKPKAGRFDATVDRLTPADKDRIITFIASGKTREELFASGLCTEYQQRVAFAHDKEFKARCRRAFDSMKPKYRPVFFPDKVATKRAVLARVREGMPIKKVETIEGMPSMATITVWRNEDAIFDRLLFKARTTHAPAWYNHSIWRDPVTKTLADDARKRLVTTIENGARIGVNGFIGENLPCGKTLSTLRRKDKKLDKIVIAAVAMRDKMERNRAIMLGEQKAPIVARRAEWIDSPDRLYLIAKNAVPASYPAHIRDDIVSGVILAVLEGRVLPTDVAAEAKRQATAYWRERPEYRLRSLDAPTFDDGKGSLHDTITTGLWQ